MQTHPLKACIQQLKNVRTMTTLALLTTLYVVLHLFVTIPISNLVEVRLSFLSIILAGLFFGPIGAAVVGCLGDILGFIVRPTGPFFPGFTLNALIVGLIYGTLLYQIWDGAWKLLFRITLAKLLCAIIVELCLTPLWLSILYSDAYVIVMQTRILKTMIFLPIDIGLVYLLLMLLPRQMKARYAILK